MEFRVVIPARYASTRLPGKVLMDINGKTMLQHTYEKAVASGAETVVIATDHKKVVEAAESFGADVCMTSEDHQSGTERISEVVMDRDYDPYDIIIGLQADEPLVPPEILRQIAADLYEHDHVKVASVCEPITQADELFNAHTVKVVLNRRHFAMYFSRSPIPWESTFEKKAQAKVNGEHYRHIGVYGYRANFLEDYMDWADCPLEPLERLEQLRILWNGGRIHMCVSKNKLLPGVDTKEDLERVRQVLK